MNKLLSSVLLMSSGALAQQLGPDTDAGRLFLVDIDGERVVYQAAFEKIWYPRLEDTFGMTLPEQLDFIEQFEYAGIQDWRIAYFWDTTPLKWSMFGHVTQPGGNTVGDYDTSVYFPYTSAVNRDGVTVYYTHGRTGDEWGDPATGGNGAIISTGTLDPFGLPSSSRYSDHAVPTPYAKEWDQPYYRFAPVYPDGRPRTFYTLTPSEAQDHWVCTDTHQCTYNEDLNYTPANLPFCLQDHRPQTRDCGAWTVTEAYPQFWVPDGEFHEIRISAAAQPDTDLMPVSLVGVWTDERADDEDVSVRETRNATVVRLRADRNNRGDGRVYHIVFSDDDKEYTFRVGVPNIVDNRHQLIDGGRAYQSN